MNDEWEKISADLTARAEALKANEAASPNYEADVKALKTEAAQLAILIANDLLAALKSEDDDALDDEEADVLLR